LKKCKVKKYMGNFNENRKAKEEAKERDKTSRENLGNSSTT